MPEITPTYQFWDDAIDARLRSMVEAGTPFSVIGVTLGRTRNACIGRAHRIGAVHNPVRMVKYSPEPARKRAAPMRAVERLFDQPATTLQDNSPTPLYAQPEASTTPFGEPVTLLKLGPRSCRFAFSEMNGQHLFCGADRDGLSPYCINHKLICYRQTSRQLSEKAYR